MRYLIFMLFFALNPAFAATDLSCKPAVVKAEDKNIILPDSDKADNSQVYVFKNISKKSLWLDRVLENRSASAGWSSYLKSGNWAALVVNGKAFKLSCSIIKPGKVEFQDCSKVVSVCTPKDFVSKSKSSGWMVEDKSWDELVAALEKKNKPQEQSSR